MYTEVSSVTSSVLIWAINRDDVGTGGEHGNHVGSSCLSLVLITVLFPACNYICLPPNTTSKLQPMDAGIIAWLKQTNKYPLLARLLDIIDDMDALKTAAAANSMARQV